MAVTSVGGQVWVKNLKKSPVLLSKMAMKHPHLKGVLFQVSLFLLLSHLRLFFCLSFSSLPLRLDIFKPKNGPPNEVLGIYIYIGFNRIQQGAPARETQNA